MRRRVTRWSRDGGARAEKEEDVSRSGVDAGSGVERSRTPTARLGADTTQLAAATGTRHRPPASHADDEASLVLGRYRLNRRLGTGAFGSVWLARDERLDRDVAVKVLPRERVIHGRFEREARAAARLAHPAIVTLYEAAVDDDGAYLVSELVRGTTLQELLESGRLSDRSILQIALALCDALAHAHEQGVIHRDVKPSNVLVPARPSGAADIAKLTDFGVARVVGGDALTHTGDVIGTLAYMAPEQAEGRDAGPASDLYSLALVIYEALTGVNPVAELRRAGRARRLGTYLPPLRRQRRDLPRQLGAGLDLALRPRPKERGDLIALRNALAISLNQVTDVKGVVAPAWGDADPNGAEGHEAHDAFGPEWREPGGAPADGAGTRAQRAGTRAGGIATSPSLISWPNRGLAAAAAGLAVGWLCAHLLVTTPLAPAAAGLLAAGAVLLLPRVGWLAAVTMLATLAAVDGRAGGALILIAILGATLLALARRRDAWPLSAGAVALGLVGLAGAWPAVVGRSRFRAWERGMLAAAGYVWLIGAGALNGHALYAQTSRLPHPSVWTGSLAVALHDVLIGLVRSDALTGALVWAAAAAVLPWIVRGRAPLRDLVLVSAWSAVIPSATAATGVHIAHGAVVGALLGGLIALTPALPELSRRARRVGSPATRLP